MHSETVEVRGHLIDSGVLSRVLDDILEYNCDYSIDRFEVGRTPVDESYARLTVKAEDAEDVDRVVVEALGRLGRAFAQRDVEAALRRRGEISVSGKANRQERLPLPVDVGEAGRRARPGAGRFQQAEQATHLGQRLPSRVADVLQALEAITSLRPDVVALEKVFADTSRGNALINRIKADPSLKHCDIRIVMHQGGAEAAWEDAEEHRRCQRAGQAAERRCDRETGYRGEKQRLSAEAGREPPPGAAACCPSCRGLIRGPSGFPLPTGPRFGIAIAAGGVAEHAPNWSS